MNYDIEGLQLRLYMKLQITKLQLVHTLKDPEDKSSKVNRDRSNEEES